MRLGVRQPMVLVFAFSSCRSSINVYGADQRKNAAASGKNAKRKKRAQSDDKSENENVQTPPRSSKNKFLDTAW
jgi:hypothetical protein